MAKETSDRTETSHHKSKKHKRDKSSDESKHRHDRQSGEVEAEEGVSGRSTELSRPKLKKKKKKDKKDNKAREEKPASPHSSPDKRTSEDEVKHKKKKKKDKNDKEQEDCKSKKKERGSDCEVVGPTNRPKDWESSSEKTEQVEEKAEEPFASLGSSERQDKFLRLLGGKKKANSGCASSGLLGRYKATGMDQNKEKSLNDGLEKQYENAWDTTRKRKGLGLGYEANMDAAAKKFHIDKEGSKSTKFD